MEEHDFGGTEDQITTGVWERYRKIHSQLNISVCPSGSPQVPPLFSAKQRAKPNRDFGQKEQNKEGNLKWPKSQILDHLL